MPPTDTAKSDPNGLSIKGSAAAGSAAVGTAGNGKQATTSEPATAGAATTAGGRTKLSFALKPSATSKSPPKVSPPKVKLDASPMTASQDVKRASAALTEALGSDKGGLMINGASAAGNGRDTKSPAAEQAPARFTAKGKVRASEEPAVDPIAQKALEALRRGDLPGSSSVSNEGPTRRSRSPLPSRQPQLAYSSDRQSETSRNFSPRRRRSHDYIDDSAPVGLPYDGPVNEAPDRHDKPPRADRLPRRYSPARASRSPPAYDRYRAYEAERHRHVHEMESERYSRGDYRERTPDYPRERPLRPASRRHEETRDSYDSAGFVGRSGDRWDDRHGISRRPHHDSAYNCASSSYEGPGYHRTDPYHTAVYGGNGGHVAPIDDYRYSSYPQEQPLPYDNDPDREPKRHAGSSGSQKYRDDRREGDREGASLRRRESREGDPGPPSKRARRESNASNRRPPSPQARSNRDRSRSAFSGEESEEGEIEEDALQPKSILDPDAQRRVHDLIGGLAPVDSNRSFRRDYARTITPNLPARPAPALRAAPPPAPALYNSPSTSRDSLPPRPQPNLAPSQEVTSLATGAIPPHAASQPLVRVSSYGTAPPPPPPPRAMLDAPPAPYRPAVPSEANSGGSLPSTTPVNATEGQAKTPAASGVDSPAADHPPPAVRTQMPQEELWIRPFTTDEEIDGIFASQHSAQAAPPAERRYVGCSHIGEYTLQEKLGEGTFGVVWKGLRGGPASTVDPAAEEEEARLLQRGLRVKRGDVVALKQIIFHNEGDGLPITSVREIRILKMLDHPNVVPVVDIAYEPADHANFKLGKTFMVFPYMDHDLAGLLENRNVTLEPAHIKQYSKQLLEGTAYLHRNLILHRDMKAANLLINNEGQLMIADFGLARSIHKADQNEAYTSCVVTRWYRPPELLLGEKRYHTPVDMWGVACVMAEMYHRSPIFPGQSDLDQACKIFAACGRPTSQSMPGWDTLPGVEGHEKFNWLDTGRSIRADWSLRADELFGDLIDRILVLDPKKRLTATEALDHEWFWTEPFPTDPARMPRYTSSHEMDGRKRKEEQHAAMGAVPMAMPMQPPPQGFPPQPNGGMRPAGPPIPAYGNPAAPMPPYGGGAIPQQPQVPVGAFNGPPPMQYHQPAPMAAYGAAPPMQGPSGMMAGMNVGMGGGGGGGLRSYAAAGPPIATAGGYNARRPGPSQFENRQGASWQSLPPRPENGAPQGGPKGKVNLFSKLAKR